MEKRNASDASKLTFRPGYTFGLGCSDWEASSYSGTIEGWSGEPFIQWLVSYFWVDEFKIWSGLDDNANVFYRYDVTVKFLNLSEYLILFASIYLCIIHQEEECFYHRI